MTASQRRLLALFYLFEAELLKTGALNDEDVAYLLNREFSDKYGIRRIPSRRAVKTIMRRWNKWRELVNDCGVKPQAAIELV